MTNQLSTHRVVPVIALLAAVSGNFLFAGAAAFFNYLQQKRTENVVNDHGETLRGHDRILSEHEELLSELGDIEVAKAIDRLVVHTPDTPYYSAWRTMPGLLRLSAPWEPATDVRSLNSIIRCRDGYEPLAVWHEVAGTYPSSDALYTLNPTINDDGGIEMAVRSRKSWRGRQAYAYIDVFLLCRATMASHP